MTWNTDAFAKLNSYKCAQINHRCQFTHRSHIVLQGRAPGGGAWTKIAQSYPKKLCAKLAGWIDNSIDLKELAGLRV